MWEREWEWLRGENGNSKSHGRTPLQHGNWSEFILQTLEGAAKAVPMIRSHFALDCAAVRRFFIYKWRWCSAYRHALIMFIGIIQMDPGANAAESFLHFDRYSFISSWQKRAFLWLFNWCGMCLTSGKKLSHQCSTVSCVICYNWCVHNNIFTWVFVADITFI